MTLTAAPATLTWRPITPKFGAELTSTSLRELDDATDLLRLVGERGVVVARDQAMSVDDQIALGRRLGPLHIHPTYADSERPELLVIHADENTKHAAGETWHSDVSCDAAPPAVSVLRMETVPECGGDTLFADMYRAFESLSSDMQAFLLGLTARHESPAHYAKGPQVRDIPTNVHPVVRTHPLTGRRALYVNSGFTTKILGLRTRESDALLRMLFDHVAYEIVNQVRVTWQPGTVVLWDNRCVQHHAAFDYWPAVRHGARVTTVGEAPYLDPEV